MENLTNKNDPRTNPRPWIRPLDLASFHLGFPLATVVSVFSGEDTNGAFLANYEHIEAHYKGPSHVHYECSETIFMLEGSVHMRISGEDITLTPGQAVHIPAGNPHGFKSTGAPGKWLLIKNPPAPPPKAPPREECDRSKFTPEQKADEDFMIGWYENCRDDFHMCTELGYPGDPK